MLGLSRYNERENKSANMIYSTVIILIAYDNDLIYKKRRDASFKKITSTLLYARCAMKASFSSKKAHLFRAEEKVQGMKVLGYAPFSELHHSALLSSRYKPRAIIFHCSAAHATIESPRVLTLFPQIRENPSGWDCVQTTT